MQKSERANRSLVCYFLRFEWCLRASQEKICLKWSGGRIWHAGYQLRTSVGAYISSNQFVQTLAGEDSEQSTKFPLFYERHHVLHYYNITFVFSSAVPNRITCNLKAPSHLNVTSSRTFPASDGIHVIGMMRVSISSNSHLCTNQKTTHWLLRDFTYWRYKKVDMTIHRFLISFFLSGSIINYFPSTVVVWS